MNIKTETQFEQETGTEDTTLSVMQQRLSWLISEKNFLLEEVEKDNFAVAVGCDDGLGHLPNIIAYSQDLFNYAEALGSAFGITGQIAKAAWDNWKESFAVCEKKWGNDKVQEQLSKMGLDEDDSFFFHETVDSIVGDSSVYYEIHGKENS